MTEGSKIALALVLVGLAYVWGGYSYPHDIWPMPCLRELKNRLIPPMEAPPTQPLPAAMAPRLSQWPGKTETECPPQTDTTAVLLILGQSNAANMSGQRYRSAHGHQVVNFYQGRCVIAGSPLLGSSDQWGESWTLLGNRLLTEGLFETVVLIPIAVSATAINRWAQGGDVNAIVAEEVSLVSRHYRVTHVLWHQGESDYAEGTGRLAYERDFHSLLETLRESGVDAPVLVSVASRCGPLADWKADNPVVQAQRSLIDESVGVFPGVNTDSLLTEDDRFDDCHFAGSGQAKFVDGWLAAIVALR